MRRRKLYGHCKTMSSRHQTSHLRLRRCDWQIRSFFVKKVAESDIIVTSLWHHCDIIVTSLMQMWATKWQFQLPSLQPEPGRTFAGMAELFGPVGPIGENFGDLGSVTDGSKSAGSSHLSLQNLAGFITWNVKNPRKNHWFLQICFWTSPIPWPDSFWTIHIIPYLSGVSSAMLCKGKLWQTYGKILAEISLPLFGGGDPFNHASTCPEGSWRVSSSICRMLQNIIQPKIQRSLMFTEHTFNYNWDQLGYCSWLFLFFIRHVWHFLDIFDLVS